MKETTQAELETLAAKHLGKAGVRAMLTSLMEAKAKVAGAHVEIESMVAIQKRAIAGDQGFSVMLDNTDFVASAAKAAAALSTMSTTYMNLAVILNSLGENVVY
ncbi:hypothetical protein ABIC83_003056 [Roseateles asaccharophilus]|uniref:hypothetical protein n=1 Tax=Roseateles asaccharophilus TaxID=582607 RepID=UPI003836C84C